MKRKYVITRVHAQYMEPRGTLGAYDASDERFTLHADVQYAHRVRDMLAGNVFKIPATQIRVVTGDVGGGFGTKGWQYLEHRLTLMAARRLGRPVKWSCERSEVLLADEHGRDVIAEAELALDKDLKFIGLRARLISNIGAYLSSDRNLLATFGSLGALVGVYDIPAGSRASDRRVLEPARDRAVSRRRPARGDLHHRAADRGCGARAPNRSRRAAPEESHPAVEAAVQDAARRAQLRLRRFPRHHGQGVEARRRRRLRQAPRRERRSAANCAASASPMRSSARPRPVPNSPSCASTPAARRPC